MRNVLRTQVVALRRAGNTYAEICHALRAHIPKSTLSYWCRNVKMSAERMQRIKKLTLRNLANGRAQGLRLKRIAAQNLRADFDKENRSLYHTFKKNATARKIGLALLYLGEGSKSPRGSLMFGNSDPGVVALFLALLRDTFPIDERKLRATVQCRADQHIGQLEKFWAATTGIPLRRFYKAQIDARTVGRPTRKPNYKGVCRIDYLSSRIDLELKHIAKKMVRL